MDLSKLPRLSETDKHTPTASPATQQLPPSGEPDPQRVYRPAPVLADSAAGQIWLSIILGIVFMMLGANFARFVGAKLSGQPYHTGVNWVEGEKAGQEVDYYDLQGYTAFTDTAVFLFGFSCILEAVVMKFAGDNSPRSRWLLTAALFVNAAMTLFNVIVAGLLFKAGIMPLMSLLVIGFGGYSTMTQWQRLQHMRAYST